MKFCDTCGQMLYLTNKQKVDGTEMLQHYCINCSTESDKPVDSVVYTQKYNEDVNASKFTDNNDIMYDNTLPCVNNIKCINENCLSNKDGFYFTISDMSEASLINTELGVEDENRLIIVRNIVKKLTDKYEFKDDLSFEYQEIDNLSRIIVKVKSTTDSTEESELFNSLRNKIKNTHIIENYKMSVIINEIIYIKTDSKNLNFTYICKNCSSSWNNK
jgi:DNA-directed RNA polymerase subunit M/transcription elongation factor TFIIS